METTYVVVQVKDKEEKIVVCNLLANTEAEFKVTTDLRTFLAEKYNVTIADKVEMKDQATDMTQDKAIDIITIKEEVVNNIVDVVSIADTLSVNTHEQHTDMADMQPADNIGAQALLHVDNQQELFNTGTLVPYSGRMIEPKREIVHEMTIEEVIADQIVPADNRDVAPREVATSSTVLSVYGQDHDALAAPKKEHFDDIVSEISPFDIVPIAQNHRNLMRDAMDVSSIVNIKSGVDDEMEHQDAVPSEIEDSNRLVLSRQVEFNEVENEKTGRVQMKRKSSKNSRRRMSATRYRSSSLAQHARRAYSLRKKTIVKNNTMKCQKCPKKISAKITYYHVSLHAMSHIDIKRFKCDKRDCSFKSRSINAIRAHFRSTHSDHNGKPKYSDILTKKGEKRLAREVAKCFPDFKIRK